MERLQFGEFTLTWLDGGLTQLDGGAMFGVVPKPLWSRKYTVNEQNQIPLRTDPILVEAHGKLYLIESGIGSGKLSDKQKRNYGVTEESKVSDSLKELGYSPNDIAAVLMTHMHFDHACGLSHWEGERLVSTFKNADIYVSQTEWDEMRNPNIRSRNTYWEENWKPIAGQVRTFQDRIEVIPGLTMIHTGGHSDGHAIILMEQNGESLIHMADLMPTHAHQNVLWVMAYDDYPMTSIDQKQKWLTQGLERKAWFTFYHDHDYRAIKWDADGKTVLEQVERRM